MAGSDMAGAAAWGKIAGGIINAAGSIYSGFQQANQYSASADAKRLEAEQTRAGNIWDQIRGNEQIRSLLSTQRAIYGQAGVRLEGAPEAAMRKSRQQYVMDRMTASRNSAYAVRALLADAKQLDRAATAAKVGGILGAVGGFFS